MLHENGYSFLHGEEGKYHFDNVVDGAEVIHFHSELVEKHFPEGLFNTFAVIRDPVDRLRSGLFRLLECAESIDMLDKVYTEDVYGILTEAQQLSNNWFRPQSDFLFPDTKIWRFEYGFGPAFLEWLSVEVGIPVEAKVVNIAKLDADLFTAPPLPPAMIEAIKAFYKEDYSL